MATGQRTEATTEAESAVQSDAPAAEDAPAFSWGSVSPQDAPEVTRGVRKSQLDGTPFLDWVESAYADKSSRQLVVPAAMAEKTERLLRRASQEKGYGIAVRREFVEGGNVAVRYSVRDKRKYEKDSAS